MKITVSLREIWAPEGISLLQLVHFIEQDPQPSSWYPERMAYSHPFCFLLLPYLIKIDDLKLILLDVCLSIFSVNNFVQANTELKKKNTYILTVANPYITKF